MCADALELAAADAAGERRLIAGARHQPGVAAREGNQRDGARRYLRAAEVRLDAQALQERDAGGGDELAAHLAAWEGALLGHDDFASRSRKEQRRRRAGGPAADDERVRSHGALRGTDG